VNLPTEQQARLQHLAQAVLSTSAHLQVTDRGVFAQPFTAERAAGLDSDSALAERVDAFAARFSRLQDLLGDKLLPALMEALGEPTRPMIDNLDHAERMGWIAKPDDWMRMRRLRNQMVHEYIKDPAVLADALQRGHDFVPVLVAAAAALIAELQRRGWA
jgi:hypothetical protein